MNVLNKQKINSIPGGIDANSIAQKIKGKSDFSTIGTDPLLLMNKVHSGLCVNCDFKSKCFWQNMSKIFCEHYQ